MKNYCHRLLAVIDGIGFNTACVGLARGRHLGESRPTVQAATASAASNTLCAGVMTSAIVPLPRLYGAVILTAVVNWFVLMWMALKVGSARKEHGIKYPLLYENKVTSQFDLYVVPGNITLGCS